MLCLQLSWDLELLQNAPKSGLKSPTEGFPPEFTAFSINRDSSSASVLFHSHPYMDFLPAPSIHFPHTSKVNNVDSQPHNKSHSRINDATLALYSWAKPFCMPREGNNPFITALIFFISIISKALKQRLGWFHVQTFTGCGNSHSWNTRRCVLLTD